VRRFKLSTRAADRPDVVRSRAWFALLAAALVGGAALLAARAPLGGDYPGPTCDTCDYPGPSIAALAHGDLHGFFAQQPVMGSASLLLRAPAAALVHGELWQYRVGALLCLLVLVGVALLLAGAMAQRGRSWALQALVAGLAVCGPLTAQALRWGHPEELMGAGLCVAAVLLAGRGRAAPAGVVLGIALATKP
jgi:hypothetical protein